MKSIKLLLATLVISAFFASCAKEEMTVMPESQNGEYVGASLLGTDISVDFVRGSQTKVSTDGKWQDSDLLGFGWIVATNPFDTQDPTADWAIDYKDKLYANHMFQKGTDGKLTTKGNVYEGWHFGYYPFSYMPVLGKQLDADYIKVNPTQTIKDAKLDRYNTRLYLSAREFLTSEDHLDPQTHQLKSVKFDMHPVFKTIAVNVTADGAIFTKDALKDLAYKSITIETRNYATFATGVKINPSALARMAYDDDDNYDAEQTKEDLYASFTSAVEAYRPAGEPYSTTTTTVIDNKNINLGGTQTLRVHTLPITKNNLTYESVSFKIKVEGGEFNVTYVEKPESELKQYEKDNNESIKDFVDAYKTGGALAAYNFDDDDEYREGKNVNLTLDAALFTPDFTNIRSEDEWNKAVKVVDALGLTEATFTIAKDNTTTPESAWKFIDKDENNKLINLPETAKLTVGSQTVNGTTYSSENIIINEAGEWPVSDKFVVNTNVVVEKNLTVNSAMIVGEGKTVTNSSTSTITIGSAGSISAVSAVKPNAQNALINNGRVIVKYGAYVYATTPGTIAYEVTSASMEEILKINTLISNDNILGNANVNTLVVKTTLDLNAQAVVGTVAGDRYNSLSNPNSYIVDLKDINIELENGSLVHLLPGVNAKVKNITAKSGVNTVNDVLVVNNVNTESGATLNFTNTVTTLSKSYFFNEIVNEGTLNVNNACINVSKVDNSTGTLTVATASHIYYSTSYKQGGSAQGLINLGKCFNFVVNDEASFKEVITNADANSTIKVADNIELTNSLEFDKTITLDLNGKKVACKTSDVLVSKGSATLTITGNGIVYASEDNSSSACAVWAKGGNVIIKNGTFKAGHDGASKAAGSPNWRNDCIYAGFRGNTNSEGSSIVVEGGEFQYTGTVDQSNSQSDGNKFLLNVNDTDLSAGLASINVKGGKFHKFNPAAAASENPVANYLVSGYKSTETATNSNIWVVSRIQ